MDLELICPDHTTLSRRSQTLKELQEQLKKVKKKESIHILIDSTGLKIYGAGEWEEAKHGKGRRKGWMKLHLAIDENSKEIEASTLTDHLTSDASQVKPLLDNVDAEIGDVKADGAYDYDSVLQVGVVAQRYFGIGSPIFLAFYLILTESDSPNRVI